MAQAAPPDPLIGQILADRYEIQSRIGEGGIGVVYKARQIAVDRPVAIKVLGAHVSSDPSWVKRFHNEARAAARLESPNTVRLIESGETKEGLLYIAMELLSGRSLAEEIAKLGRLPPVRMVRILAQVCESLQEAHDKGIIHRDIKPDNIFLVENRAHAGSDFVKVLDFSVAKIDTPDAQATRVGTVFGTPPYMSPEQGSAVKLTAQSDLYSAGIVAYEMLTGKPPFEARIPMEVLMMHMRNQPPPLIGFPEPVVKLVMRALEKQPPKRQASAAEMQQECQSCLDQLLGGAQGSGNAPVYSTGNVPIYQQQPPPVQQQQAPPPTQQQPQVQPVQQQQQQAPLAHPVNYDQRVVGSNQAAQNKTQIAQPFDAGSAGRSAFNNSSDGVQSTMFMAEMPISPASMALRQQILAPRPAGPAAAGPLFYVGWALIGLAAGLLLHFLAVAHG